MSDSSGSGLSRPKTPSFHELSMLAANAAAMDSIELINPILTSAISMFLDRELDSDIHNKLRWFQRKRISYNGLDDKSFYEDNNCGTVRMRMGCSPVQKPNQMDFFAEWEWGNIPARNGAPAVMTQLVYDNIYNLVSQGVKVDAHVFESVTRTENIQRCVYLIFFKDFWIQVSLKADFPGPHEIFFTCDVQATVLRNAYTKQRTDSVGGICFRKIKTREYSKLVWRRICYPESEKQSRIRPLGESQHERLGKDSLLGKTLTPDVLALVARNHDTGWVGHVRFGEIRDIFNAQKTAMDAAQKRGQAPDVSKTRAMCMSCGLRIVPIMGIQ
jgi:hypothetical protein